MDIRDTVRTYYTDRLEQGSCCGPVAPAQDIPSFGCGDPTGFAELRPGEVVLDLGSGAGMDAFRAAEAVGAAGRVIGVDMTPAMVDRAREGAARLGLTQVDVREGFIEDLPVDAAGVDVVMSNCVVNQSTDKGRVFREAMRVLRPGGRVRMSDILRRGARLTAPSDEGWCACIDGAESPATYAEHLRAAGFVDVDVEAPPADIADGATYSATVRARKPYIRAAREDEAAALATLLSDADLPSAGLADSTLFVLDEDGETQGLVGLEPHGAYVLLRSLVVAPRHRGRGMGRALLAFAENEARRGGFEAAYGLTTTIPDLLRRHGFAGVGRSALPAALDASAELRGACPATAQAFVKRLA